jgi:hypothetical protein
MVLIHSSVLGHISCFHSLATENSATINIAMQVSLMYLDLHFFGHILGVVLVDHMAALFLAF